MVKVIQKQMQKLASSIKLYFFVFLKKLIYSQPVLEICPFFRVCNAIWNDMCQGLFCDYTLR
jgi:hypothetical protein